MAFKVVRKFERHDEKALRKYTRGQTISDKEANKMPEKTIQRLLNAGSITRILEPLPGLKAEKPKAEEPAVVETLAQVPVTPEEKGVEV